MISGKRILILAPHTDDGELGCGGAISNLLETNEVFYVAFSSCRHSVPSAFSPDILQSELITATRHLGIKQENVKLLDYEVRRFNYQRQEILDDMLNIRKDIAPDIVFMPSTTDLHQDHFTITSEGVRAFKYSTILSYELPWNNIVFSPKCYIALREEDLHKPGEPDRVRR